MSPISQPQPEVVSVDAVATAVIGDTVAMADLPSFFDRAFAHLGAALGEQGVPPTGPAFALYHGPPAASADLEVGFPTAHPIQPHGEVRAGRLPGGRVTRLVHAGGYEQLGPAWGRLRAWMGQQGLTPGGDLWEVYLTEPSPGMDPADLRTQLNWAIDG